MNSHESHDRKFMGDVYNVGLIFVYADDGPIPHFHIQREMAFDVNVLLTENSFYIHGDTERAKTGNASITLDEGQCIILDYWLSGVNNKSTKRNWQLICEMWNRLNPDHKIDRQDMIYKPFYQEINQVSDCSWFVEGLGDIHIFADEFVDATPHFHIVTSGKPDCCICLYSNEYYYIGNNRQLSHEEHKTLINWLAKINDNNISNWNMLRSVWNKANYRHPYIPSKEERIPVDYSTIHW